jgi:hypothetical protein
MKRLLLCVGDARQEQRRAERGSEEGGARASRERRARRLPAAP